MSVGGDVADAATVKVKERCFLNLHSAVDDRWHSDTVDFYMQQILVTHRCIKGQFTCIMTWTKKWKFYPSQTSGLWIWTLNIRLSWWGSCLNILMAIGAELDVIWYWNMILWVRFQKNTCTISWLQDRAHFLLMIEREYLYIKLITWAPLAALNIWFSLKMSISILALVLGFISVRQGKLFFFFFLILWLSMI